MIRAENEASVDVTADFGELSALDTGGVDGEKKAEDAAPEEGDEERDKALPGESDAAGGGGSGSRSGHPEFLIENPKSQV